MKGLSFICAFIILFSWICIEPISAKAESDTIDPGLVKRLGEVSDDELLSVTLWTNGFSFSEYENQAVKEISDLNVEIQTMCVKSGVTEKAMQLDEIDDIEISNYYIERKREIYSKAYSQYNLEISEHLLEIVKTTKQPDPLITWISSYSPLIKMKLTKTQIERIAQISIVSKIFMNDYTENEIATSSYNGTTPSTVWQGTTKITHVRDTLHYTGSGVKVGLYDVGVLNYEDTAMAPYRSVFTTLYNSGRLISDPYAPTADPEHAAYCGSLIAATDGNEIGVAPGVTLYSTTGGNRVGEMEGAMEWLISKGVRIISCSVAWVSDYNEYDYISQWFDHIAIQHDVTIIVAGGNEGSLGTQGGEMSYNAIVVGSNDDKNTLSRTDDEVSSFSSYNSSSYVNLPIKPDILAPGDGIMTPLGASGGTSVSCPIVAGIIALLYQIRPGLSSKQALTKSVLLAGISDCGTSLMKKSVAGGTDCAMFQDAGAGLVDAKGATYVAANHRYESITMDQNTDTYTTTFTVTASDSLTRVNMSWLKNNRLTGNHSTYNTPSDPACAVLYLEVIAPDGTTYKSCRGGGNVQNICFNPQSIGTYTINITKISAPTSENNIYIGLSWY